MKKHLLPLISFLSLIVASSWAHAEQLNLAGSCTLHMLVKNAGKEFQNETGIKVKVKGGGSDLGIRKASDGSIDIGMITGQLNDSAPKDLIVYPVGSCGLALIVNSSNNVSSLSKNQVSDIFSGKIKNWKDLGGPNKKIILETKNEGRASKVAFETFFNLEGQVAKSHVVGSNTESISYVAATPDSIGYVALASAMMGKNKGLHLKLVTLDNIEPTQANIVNKTYPIIFPISFITKGEPSENAKKFLDFMKGPKGQQIVERVGHAKL